MTFFPTNSGMAFPSDSPDELVATSLNIDGADPDLNPMMVPTADPDRRGGNRLDGLLGLNAVFGGHAVMVEAGLPLHQDLDGPQLETDWTLGAGYQFAF